MVAKKKKTTTPKQRATPRQMSSTELDRALHTDLPYSPTLEEQIRVIVNDRLREYQDRINLLTRQRDDALGQLTRRANALKLVDTHDQLLTRLDAMTQTLAKIVRAFGDFACGD